MKRGFDLDGTVAELDISKGKFDNDYFLSREVKLNPWDIASGSDEVVIISARPESSREATETWLKRNFIAYDKLILLNFPAPAPEENREQVLLEHARAKAEAIQREGIEIYYEDMWEIADYLKGFFLGRVGIVLVE